MKDIEKIPFRPYSEPTFDIDGVVLKQSQKGDVFSLHFQCVVDESEFDKYTLGVAFIKNDPFNPYCIDVKVSLGFDAEDVLRQVIKSKGEPKPLYREPTIRERMAYR